MCKLIDKTVHEERRTARDGPVNSIVDSLNPPRYPLTLSQSALSSAPVFIPLQPLRKSQTPVVTPNHNPTNEDNPPEYSSLFPSSSSS